jgi:IS4 transposase
MQPGLGNSTPISRNTSDFTGKRITFLTNNFALKPELIADLYRQRWQVELFFKWIKQHLGIKTFYGTNENAVKTQIRIAVCTYVLIAIAKKRLHLPKSLHEILYPLKNVGTLLKIYLPLCSPTVR